MHKAGQQLQEYSESRAMEVAQNDWARCPSSRPFTVPGVNIHKEKQLWPIERGRDRSQEFTAFERLETDPDSISVLSIWDEELQVVGFFLLTCSCPTWPLEVCQHSFFSKCMLGSGQNNVIIKTENVNHDIGSNCPTGSFSLSWKIHNLAFSC